jgi:hypothetical protein
VARSRISFPPRGDREKRVCSSAVKLLVRRRFRGREPRDCQELGEELCTEMPPRVPEKILRRRRQPTNWDFKRELGEALLEIIPFRTSRSMFGV